MVRLWLALALLLAGGQALAFHLEVRSDNPLVSEAELKEMVIAASKGVPHQIPQTQKVYVSVLTRAKPRFLEQTKYLFFHRVELRRHFTSKDPYTVNAWLPIKREELYGVDGSDGVRQALQATLRRFFADANNLNVNVEFKPAAAQPARLKKRPQRH